MLLCCFVELLFLWFRALLCFCYIIVSNVPDFKDSRFVFYIEWECGMSDENFSLSTELTLRLIIEELAGVIASVQIITKINDEWDTCNAKQCANIIIHNNIYCRSNEIILIPSNNIRSLSDTVKNQQPTPCDFQAY